MRQLTRLAVIAAGAGVVLSIVTGCANQPAPEPDEMTLAQLEELEDETRAKMVDCLIAKGWEVESDDYGYGVSSIPESQVDRYEEDNEGCLKETGADQIKPAVLTDARLREFYSYELGTAECLRGQGFEIPPAPSEQAFMDSYRSGSPWSAYGHVPESVSQDEWAAVIKECPQL